MGRWPYGWAEAPAVRVTHAHSRTQAKLQKEEVLAKPPPVAAARCYGIGLSFSCSEFAECDQGSNGANQCTEKHMDDALVVQANSNT